MEESTNVVPLVRRRATPTKLTQRTVELAKPRAERYEIRDPALPGFLLRVTPTGKKTYYVSTRVGHGRAGKRVRVQIGDATIIDLSEARNKARRIIADAKEGIDPTEESDERPIRAHLDDYEAELDRRNVVKMADMMNTLRRGLNGKTTPSEVNRAMIVAEIERLEQAGRVGAAEYFRKTAATFLNWLVGRGAIPAHLWPDTADRERPGLSASRRPAGL